MYKRHAKMLLGNRYMHRSEVTHYEEAISNLPK